jgi:hypothetical protein
MLHSDLFLSSDFFINSRTINPKINKMIKKYSLRSHLVALLTCVIISLNVNAQLTGIKNIPGDYATLALAINDMNAQGVGAGGVTLNLLSGNPETAPAGGYVIGDAGSVVLTTANAGNQVIIEGNGNIITAAAAPVAGSKTDAVFKIIGADYITVQNFSIQENAANTTGGAIAVQQMTEFGIAIFAVSTTDGAQNNTIKNNTITLSSATAYQNAIGIFSTSASSSTNGVQAAASVAGTNSNNKFYGNTISGVAWGIYFISPAQTATVFENGNDIGGSSLATGNTINFGVSNTAGDLGFTSFSGTTPSGVYFRNVVGNSAKYNSITSSASLTLPSGGIFSANGTSPTGVTYTSNFSFNNITLNNTGTTALTGIDFGSGLSTGTLIASNNTIILNRNATASSSAVAIGIKANYSTATNTCSNNTITINESSSGTGAISGTATGLDVSGTSTTINATANSVLISQTTSSALGMANSLMGIKSTSAATTLNITGNTVTFKQAATGAGTYGSGAVTFVSYNASHTTVNITGNTFNTTGSTIRSTGSLDCILGGGSTISGLTTIKTNVSNVDRIAASGTVGFFTQTSTAPNDPYDSISSNNITFTNLATSSAVVVINRLGGSTTAVKNVCNNTISVSGTNTGAVTGISCSYSSTSLVSGNIITVNCAATSVTGINTPSGNVGNMTIRNNTFSLTSSAVAPTAMVAISGTVSSSGPYTVTNNNFTDLSFTGVITSSPTVSGIVISVGSGNNISNNVVKNISTGAAGSTGSPVIDGILVSGGTSTSVFRNKIYGLTTEATGTSTLINGIRLSGGTTNNVYNNLIGNLTTPAAANADAIRGVAVTSAASASVNNIYYNTIYLNASSTGTNFGTTGIYHTANATATTAKLDLRNNIIVNNSTASGTGLTVAYRRSAVSFGNYASTSNNNIFYAGTPGATNLIFYDGTNSDQTLAAFQTRVGGSIDASSKTENVSFTSTTGSSSSFLHVNTATPTIAESGAVNIASYTTDYDSDIRQGNAGYAGTGTAPDVGADEFAGTSPAPVITFTSSTPALTPAQCVKSDRAIVMNITTISGTITGAVLNYNHNGVAQPAVTLTNTSGSVWEGTMIAPVTGNAAVTWTVTATNSLGISTIYNGTGYSDEPTTGVTAIASASPATICSGASSSLSGTLIAPGSAVVGAGGTTSSSYPNPIYSNWANNKMQILYLASELTAAGIAPGNLTAMSLNLTSTSTTGRSNFTVNIANTSVTALTTTFLTPSFTQVYTTGSYVPAVGTNTFTFGTGGGSASSFNWNGTSNIVIQICWDNIASTATESSTCTADNTSFASVVSFNRTSTTGTSVCGIVVTGNNTYTIRPTLRFYGNTTQTVAGISWSDGTSTVGTTNPLSVSPTATTTYSAVVTYSGCPVNSNPVTVTVNPLPSAPTATNSSQCGTQIPLASVSSTAGVSGTGTFNWYAASTGGVALQSSTSATYQSTVASTTTFYVSESGTNGCESPRTAVTVTVGSAPALTLSSSSVNICIGATSSTISLTSSVSSFNSYTWSPATNVSGNENTGWTFNPTSTTTYTLTANNVSTGCSNVVTLTVTVNPLPLITSVTTSADPICEGSSTTLSAVSIPASSGSAVVGAGATTASGAYSNPFYSNWSHSQQQILVKASELSAAGLVAGNITALSLNVISGTTNMPDFSLSMQHTSLTAMSTLVSAGWSTVYTNATGYTPVIGNNTITFATPFNWDGTSNILLKFCWGNSSTTATVSSSVSADNTSYVSGVNAHNTSATSGSSICSSTTVYLTYSTRPKLTFNGQVGVNLTSSLNWGWSPATGLSSSTGNSVTASPLTTTTYTVTATNGSTTCSSSQSITVNVNPKPVSPVNGNITQCGVAAPSPAVNYVTDPNGFTSPTFNWYAGSTGGSSLLSTTNTTLSPSLSVGVNTFYVSLTNPATGCVSDRTAVTITVNAPPALTLSSSNTSICAGTTLSVTATAGGTSYDSFVWSPAATVTGNETSGWIFNPSVTTSYALTASNSVSGCINTAGLTITVNPLPVISSVTSSANPICAGSSTNLTALSVISTTGLVNIGTATTLTGATSQPTAFCNRWPNYWSQTIYTAAELSATGLVAGNITSMAYNISTLGDGATNPNLTVKIGTIGGTNFTSTTFVSTASFTTVYGPATYTHSAPGLNTITFATPYVWDGVSNIVINVTMDGADAINNSQTYYTATPDNKTLWATSYTGTTTTGTYSLNRLNVVFNGQKATSYTSSLNWLWSPSGSLNTATANAVIATPASTTTYTVTATDPTTTCSASQSITVTVNPLPTVAVVSSDADNAICSGSSVTLSGSGATTYSWTGSVNNGVSFTPSATATYTVTGTDANGCINTATQTVTVNALPTVSAMAMPATLCAGDATSLMGMGATSYAWTGGVMDGVSFTPSATNTYTVTGTDANGCTNTATQTVTVNALPTVSAMAMPATLCAGNSTTLMGMGATSYVWTGGVTDGVSFTPSATDTYTVTGTDANGCTNTATQAVTVNALPTVSVMAMPATLCSGGSTTLMGMGAQSYVWTGGVTDGVSFTPSATDTYTVTGTDANGCTNTATQTVTVNATPVVDLGADIIQCAGTVVLDAGNAGLDYVWNDASNSQTLTVSTTGTYSVTVTDLTTSCSSTDMIDVTIDAMPVQALGSDIAQCGGMVTLDAGNPGAMYMWNDMSTAQTVTTSTSGMYFVTVTNGTCSANDTVNVTINMIPSVSITPFGTPVCDNDVAFTLSNGSPAGGVYSGTGVSAGMFDPSVSGSGMFLITYTVTDGTTMCSASDTTSIMVDLCSGIASNGSQEIIVYPNPASNMIFITTDNAGFEYIAISIVDIQGKEVYSERDDNISTAYNKQINIEKFAKGVYYIKMDTGKNRKIEKLIVN